ncbi:MAG: hypothetical protein IKU07_01370 [Oscillospiraceae bacterium]|nr:hypothetical protein [Oscillospiraceae bacterium]
MKKLICLLLVMLLLCGCAPKGEEEFQIVYPTVSPTEPESAEDILAYRRDVVEQAMREQSAILWTPAETFTYSRRNNSKGIVLDEEETPGEVSTFYAGRIYQGIPYAHGSGSYYSFLSFATDQTEDGVYTLTGLTDQLLTGSAGSRENRRARIGNDCADQLFWAWSRISPSIQFGFTGNMTEFYGCLKVGDYEYTGTNFSAENNTKDIVKANGEQRMFAAYAQLQKGDGMVLITRSGAGHAVMVVTTNPVYLEDGTIDGEKSYVTVLEQTSGEEEKAEPYFNEELQQLVYPCEIMDKEWTYNTLFKKAYLPVTCKELVDPSPLPEAAITDYTDAPTYENMFAGILTANYRFSSITVTISQKGKTVQEATCFGHQNEMYEFNLYRFTSGVEKDVMQGYIDKDALAPGTYQCTFTARISTGDNITFRDFTFEK